jgi:hypothetical protein
MKINLSEYPVAGRNAARAGTEAKANTTDTMFTTVTSGRVPERR